MKSYRLCCLKHPFISFAWLLTVFCLLSIPNAVSAGVTFTDISPDKSTYYQPNSAFGASGGRVNKVASVAGTNMVFYAASEWGGLYKTIDGGVTWFRLDGHLPVAVWDVKVDPVNTNIVYATSFYDGRVNSLAGINVSYDGGATWFHPATARPNPGVNTGAGFSCSQDRINEPSAFGIAIQPDDPKNVFIGTNCGLAYSDDHGATWRYVNPAPGESNCIDMSSACDVWDVIAQEGGIVDLCGDDGHRRSTSSSRDDWTGGLLPYQAYTPTETPGRRCSITASPYESYVLFIADDDGDHHVYESDEGGKPATWKDLGSPYSSNHVKKRIPFVVNNKRHDRGLIRNFDLWYGEQDLWRIPCSSPLFPMPGGNSRCQMHIDAGSWTLWTGPFSEAQGAHGDSGYLAFDRTKTVDACPVIYSSDGGVFRNTRRGSDCHDPQFAQPEVSPHALWLWGMGGANLSDGSVVLHFGVQDDGEWATPDARYTPPNWSDRGPSDAFTNVADEKRVVWFGHDDHSLLYVVNPGKQSGFTVHSPPLSTDPSKNEQIVSFRFIPSIARVGDKKYAIVTESSKVYYTDDIYAGAAGWHQLGASNTPGGVCGIRASVDPARPDSPVFYVQAGNCNPGWTHEYNGDQLWKYVGTSSTGTWEQVDNTWLIEGNCQLYGPWGSGSKPCSRMWGGIGIFGVDPNNTDRLYASNLRSTWAEPQMVFSNDGGKTWHRDIKLDNMMTGNGFFRYRTERGVTTDVGFRATFYGYAQPSLVAFDPDDPNILIAGGRDSGLFFSKNGGKDWLLLTDPFDSGNSGIPNIPRPWFSHFHHDQNNNVYVYVGTQGRGVWRIRIPYVHLFLEMACGPQPVVNEDYVCNITVKNNGPEDATEVWVTEMIPAGFDFISGTAPGSCGNSKAGPADISCFIGDLASGAEQSIKIVLRPTVTGTLSHSATVSSNELNPGVVVGQKITVKRDCQSGNVLCTLSSMTSTPYDVAGFQGSSLTFEFVDSFLATAFPVSTLYIPYGQVDGLYTDFPITIAATLDGAGRHVRLGRVGIDGGWGNEWVWDAACSASCFPGTGYIGEVLPAWDGNVDPMPTQSFRITPVPHNGWSHSRFPTSGYDLPPTDRPQVPDENCVDNTPISTFWDSGCGGQCTRTQATCSDVMQGAGLTSVRVFPPGKGRFTIETFGKITPPVTFYIKFPYEKPPVNDCNSGWRCRSVYPPEWQTFIFTVH